MSDRSLFELEEFFLALSDGTRLRLLNLMRDGEVSVGYLSEKLDQSQPKISRHLAYLRSAGLVETRRDGKWIYYHISEPASEFASTSLDDALDWAGNLTGHAPVRKRTAAMEFFNEPDDERQNESVEEESYSNDIEVYLL
jgi:DNA-binding transcriptional ArsR family regulator